MAGFDPSIEGHAQSSKPLGPAVQSATLRLELQPSAARIRTGASRLPRYASHTVYTPKKLQGLSGCRNVRGCTGDST